jgi:DMSO/TMAO reductase YedYZ molybdopterin-dependent catalytic subunit
MIDKQDERGWPSFGAHASTGQIIRRKEPENVEFFFPALDRFITPAESFYVRSHFPRPAIEASAWRLKIEGAVEKPREFTLDDLKKLPEQTRMVTLECAGNGRVFLIPKATGDNWELGAVSNAEWTGVALSVLLAEVGVKPGAVEIVFVGADEGEPDDPPKPPGKINYARGIPLSKIDDALLAYQMNGRPLGESHGAPLRAVVGGWYGMASVKWLDRIVVSARPFRGYFQSIDYSYWDKQAGMPIRAPLGEMSVKAQIARPALHERIPCDTDYRIVGAAWAGDSEVASVEITADGGKSYGAAVLLGEPIRHAWRFWEYAWRTPSSPGKCILMARATDARGKTQPSEHDKKFGNYVVCHTLPLEVVLN